MTQAREIALTFSNRLTTASDGWIHLAPLGDWPHYRNDGDNAVQRLNAATVAAMVADWEKQGSPQLLIDYDHGSERDDGGTEAAGWINALEARADGLYGKVEWTDAGKAAVNGKRYRFISPVWLAKANGKQVDELPVVEPFALLRAAVTNRPNLPVKPLTNASRINPQVTDMSDTNTDLKKIANRLGLSESATGAEILAALPAPADAKALQNRITELEADNKKLKDANEQFANAQLDEDMKRFAPVIGEDEADKKDAREFLQSNRAIAVKAYEKMLTLANKGQTTPGALTNRAPAKTPGTSPAATAGTDNAAAIEREVQDYKNSKGCTYEAAFAHIQRSKPELFTNRA